MALRRWGAMNRPLDSAWAKGYQAARDGLPASSCPYTDKRGRRGQVTFARAFMHRWQEGWNEGRATLRCGRRKR